MHKKNTQRWSKLISTAGILAVLFGGLFAQSVRAVISNPTPVCVGTTCTLTFDATGDYYLWSPPIGARNISFDLMGAQGGRTGGLGGRVQGSFVTTPASLYIYVGGAGLTGAGAAGGYNGGGAAGGNRGDEGSGGGATDIRSTTALADRIVVAGGGGGTGGLSGGPGGAAGGLTGTNGTSGQGGGGAGATQSGGGSGGSPNGGTWGTSGGLGVGGTGGTSSTAGGGGGGGGYYGGGGGGADTDSCCTNGGGGGGGSSYNNSTLTTSVVHTAGYRSGAGVAVISYVMPPSVTTFTPGSTLTNSTSISYNVVFNESVTGLTNTDFVTTGSTATCSTVAVSGTGTSYLVTASGCTAGAYKLTLLANAITGTVSGPSADVVSADVVIDRTVPTVTVTSPASTTTALTFDYQLTFSESVTDLTASDFTISGSSCAIGSVTGSGTQYTVRVQSCADGANAYLVMLPNSVSDAALNLGPASAPAFTTVSVDRSASAPTWASAVATSYTSPSFVVDFTEALIGFTSSDVSNTGTATGCVISMVSNTVTRYTITTTGCSLGSVQLSIAQGAYADALGNTGPQTVSASSVTTVIAQPAPTPAPTPTPTPTASPIPTAAPAPVSGGSGGGGSSGSSGTSTPATNPAPVELNTNSATNNMEIIAAQPVRKTYAFSSAIKLPTSPLEEPIAIYEPDAPQITVDNPTDDPPPVAPKNDWQQYAIIGVGSLSGLLATIGVIQAARQMRNRRLVKKFA
jgi:hypothetical protein